ncbi:unnamed protein product [Psylliodes chrysocephalus]|uniref:Uncharacterized protein n=1 Tax=Psylliodes chrysocephalus TaxID=3402493 RepID=A0A9P0CYG1_9CUCU|nr:unnamed protein product [Psylliodes chrysocephala]
MVAIFSNYLENTSVSDVIHLYWNSAILYLTDIFAFLRTTEVDTYFQSFANIFDDFQWNLLQIFICLIVINLISIAIVWKYYGESICKHFMTNPTLREIEELKASVAKLKLPKEHTPRI